MIWHALSPFLGKLQPVPGGQHAAILVRWKGVIHASDPDTHLVPTMLNGVHVWFMSWPVHDLHIILYQKSSCVTCCVGCDIVFDIHKVSSKKRPSPREAYYRQETWCSIGGWGFHPAPPVHSSHHGGWYHILRGQGYPLLVGYTHLSVSLLVHMSTTITGKQHLSSHQASPVIQCQSGTLGLTPGLIARSQKPVHNAPNWQPHPKTMDHLHVQKRDWDKTIVPDHLEQLSLSSGCGQTTSPNLHIFADLAEQCFSCIAKFC